MVSTHVKNISQTGSFPQVEVKMQNVWNHHLENNIKLNSRRKKQDPQEGAVIHSKSFDPLNPWDPMGNCDGSRVATTNTGMIPSQKRPDFLWEKKMKVIVLNQGAAFFYHIFKQKIEDPTVFLKKKPCDARPPATQQPAIPVPSFAALNFGFCEAACCLWPWPARVVGEKNNDRYQRPIRWLRWGR